MAIKNVAFIRLGDLDLLTGIFINERDKTVALTYRNIGRAMTSVEAAEIGESLRKELGNEGYFGSCDAFLEFVSEEAVDRLISSLECCKAEFAKLRESKEDI